MMTFLEDDEHLPFVGSDWENYSKVFWLLFNKTEGFCRCSLHFCGVPLKKNTRKSIETAPFKTKRL